MSKIYAKDCEFSLHSYGNAKVVCSLSFHILQMHFNFSGIWLKIHLVFFPELLQNWSRPPKEVLAFRNLFHPKRATQDCIRIHSFKTDCYPNYSTFKRCILILHYHYSNVSPICDINVVKRQPFNNVNCYFTIRTCLRNTKSNIRRINIFSTIQQNTPT